MKAFGKIADANLCKAPFSRERFRHQQLQCLCLQNVFTLTAPTAPIAQSLIHLSLSFKLLA
jgi:hypothetical protein